MAVDLKPLRGDTIVTVRAYLDSTVATYTMLRNEKPAQR